MSIYVSRDDRVRYVGYVLNARCDISITGGVIRASGVPRGGCIYLRWCKFFCGLCVIE